MCRLANQNHTVAHNKGQWSLLKASFSEPGVILIMIQIINLFFGGFVCMNFKCQFIIILLKEKKYSQSCHQGKTCFFFRFSWYVYTWVFVCLSLCVQIHIVKAFLIYLRKGRMLACFQTWEFISPLKDRKSISSVLFY